MVETRVVYHREEAPDLLDKADRFWAETLGAGLVVNWLLPASGAGSALMIGGTLLGLHRLARHR